MLRLVVLGQGLESGEGGLVGLKGLEGGQKRLRSVGLLGRVDDMNLVLVVLRRGLRSHVVDVLDLGCAGVVVGLLDRVGSLWGGFCGLGVMRLVNLLLLMSRLWRHLGLMMTFQTLTALMRVAVSV